MNAPGLIDGTAHSLPEFPETGAARHFRTNAHQIPATILESEAPDDLMIAANPRAARTAEAA